MSNPRRYPIEREDNLRPLRRFAETFMPFIILIGAAMTWYSNSASIAQVDARFQESLKYTDKAVSAIQTEANARMEVLRAEAHREAEANKIELKDFSNANRQGMRIEFKEALSEVTAKQAAMDSKLDYLIDSAESDRPHRPLKRR